MRASRWTNDVPMMLAVLLLAHPSAAQDAEGQDDAHKGEAVSVGVATRAPVHDEAHRQVILSEPKAGERRKVPVAVSVGTSERLAVSDAEAVVQEITPFFGAREEQYRAWVRGTIDVAQYRVRPGVLKLANLESRMELRCPREVMAGKPIALEIVSAGNQNIEWHAYVLYPTPVDGYGDEPTDRSLVRPDVGRYEMQKLSAGAKVEGGQKKQLSFNTFPADRGTCLGVRIENPQHSEDGKTFWVRIR